jgi:hypothetical protein
MISARSQRIWFVTADAARLTGGFRLRTALVGHTTLEPHVVRLSP